MISYYTKIFHILLCVLCQHVNSFCLLKKILQQFLHKNLVYLHELNKVVIYNFLMHSKFNNCHTEHGKVLKQLWFTWILQWNFMMLLNGLPTNYIWLTASNKHQVCFACPKLQVLNYSTKSQYSKNLNFWLLARIHLYEKINSTGSMTSIWA